MKNPFEKSTKSHIEPNAYPGSEQGASTNKLLILAGIVTFVILIIVFESVVVIYQQLANPSECNISTVRGRLCR